MKVKVTLSLDEKAWQALRIQALKEKRPASEIIDELVAAYLKRKGGQVNGHTQTSIGALSNRLPRR